MRMGKSGFQAALDASDEIGLAVVATSFTIIAVFLPVSFMGGVSGQFFRQFGLTVAVAVFISLLVARLITPVLAAYALRRDPGHEQQADGPIMMRYMTLLHWCVINRWKTMAGGTVFFMLSIVALTIVPQSFLPPEDFSNSQLAVELPPGGTLADTARVSADATAILRRSPEVTDVVEFVGGDDGEIRNGSIFISLVPRSERTMSQKEWEQSMMPALNRVPDGRLNFQSQGGGGGRDLQFYLTGDEPPLVEETGRKVITEMQKLNEIRDPRIRGDLPRPEIVIKPRLDVAAQLGVSVESISQTVRIATLGDLPQNGAKFSLSDRQIPDPREPGRGCAPRSVDAAEPAGADRLGGGRAAQIGGRPEFRPGTIGGAPLQSKPAGLHRGGPESRRGAGRGHQEDLCAAQHGEPAPGRAPGQDRQHRIFSRDDAETSPWRSAPAS